jgi:hypothetical protein
MALNVRWKWYTLMPAYFASSASDGTSSDLSIRRQALAILFAFSSAMLAWLGLHRLQGRNPAFSAVAQLSKYFTFSGRASLAAHAGLQ